MFSSQAMFAIWLIASIQSFVLLLIGTASITVKNIWIFEIKPHSDFSLIRFQVLSCLAALIASFCAYCSFANNPDPVLCSLAVRLGTFAYSISKGFLYCFFDQRLASVRQGPSRTTGEKVAFTGTISVFIIAIGFLVLSTGKLKTDSDGFQYCAIDVSYWLFAIMVAQDIVLSPAYLVMFIRPLIEINRQIQSTATKTANNNGTKYNLVIRRNAIASGASTIITASFLTGYMLVANLNTTIGRDLESLFNMMRALDLFFNCLTMFVCTIAVWHINQSGKRSHASSDDSAKKKGSDGASLHVRKDLFPHDLAGGNHSSKGGDTTTTTTSIPHVTTSVVTIENEKPDIEAGVPKPEMEAGTC